MKSVSLGSIVTIKGGGTPDKENEAYWGGSVPWASVKDFKSTEISKTTDHITADGVVHSATNIIPKGNIIVPTRMAVGKAAINTIDLAINQDLKALIPHPIVDTRYLLYCLLASGPKLERYATGATVKGITLDVLRDLQIPLPPLDEQRRIAAILDATDSLRVKRRAALAKLDTLVQSIFIEMFGDPVTNSKGWRVVNLVNLLSLPLRNGVSPSTEGRIQAKVLTLSAVTGDFFNGTAWKEAPFIAPPPDEQRVRATDLLICRGNGNLHLVGKGYFPSEDMKDVTFPDTIIAARVDCDKIAPKFLEVLWNSPATRRQIEALARTTNGTFKVNQGMLEGVRLLSPPISEQRKFSDRLLFLAGYGLSQAAFLTNLNTLFASLQNRAFRGEL